ncbi:hypothetical protein [Bacillus wiedmannii]|uniref:hypothetical protein n=1 Tax=Bacillus wiedmannii TaxID=1890302 RepID=UPI000BFA3243|nr:hypothetical protein [Bacillus wiedmannii]PGA34011.1 hypothetical protein COL74_12245 [Bacillus wiedmannii]
MTKLDGVKVVNETVEYNGFVYESVTDGAKTNDLIQCLEDDAVDLTYGAFYQVIGTDDDNDMQFLDDDNDERDRSVTDEEYKVFRKSHAITNDKLTDAEGVVKIELPDGTKLEGTPSDLEKITRSMQALQAEQVATVKMPEEAVEVEDEGETVSERLQVGDYAKVIEEGTHSAKVGDIVKIFVDDEDNQPFKCEDLQGKGLRYPWFYERGLVKATDEEVLEAKQALLKEGDFARVIGNTSRHQFEKGTVVKLGKPIQNGFMSYYLDESNYWAVKKKDLESLTAEEAEHIAREAEEEKKAKAEREKWAVIGREVGEYKKGDVVLVIDKGSSDLYVDEIGTVSFVDTDNTVRVVTVNCDEDDSNWLHTSRIVLVVPVEQRFDTVG